MSAGHPQAVVGREPRPDGRGVVAAGEGGHLVDHRESVVVERLVGAGHHPPAVPGQQLDLVEAGEVAEHVPGDELQAPHVEDPEPVGVDLAGPGGDPRLVGAEEAPGGWS